MNVDKIELVFLCFQDKKSGYESQGVVKKKVLFKKNDLWVFVFFYSVSFRGGQNIQDLRRNFVIASAAKQSLTARQRQGLRLRSAGADVV